MKQFIIKAEKDIGILLEGLMHIQATGKRKAKKAFRKQFKSWKIVDMKLKEVAAGEREMADNNGN